MVKGIHKQFQVNHILNAQLLKYCRKEFQNLLHLF